MVSKSKILTKCLEHFYILKSSANKQWCDYGRIFLASPSCIALAPLIRLFCRLSKRNRKSVPINCLGCDAIRWISTLIWTQTNSFRIIAEDHIFCRLCFSFIDHLQFVIGIYNISFSLGAYDTSVGFFSLLQLFHCFWTVFYSRAWIMCPKMSPLICVKHEKMY